mgnify:CR=1 FL=1
MGYKKKTLKDFKVDLDGGHYSGVTGARRAVGKFADWSPPDRLSAQKLIDAHFEGNSVPAKKTEKPEKTPKQAKGKKPVASKTPKAQAKSTAAPAVVAKQAKSSKAEKAPKPAKRAVIAEEKAAIPRKARATKASTSLVDVSNNLGTFEEALRSIETIRRIDHNFDVTPGLTEAHEGIRGCLVRLRQLSAVAGSPEGATTTSGALGANGRVRAAAANAPLPVLSSGGLPGFVPQS